MIVSYCTRLYYDDISMYIYIYIYIYIYRYIYVCIYIYIHMYVAEHEDDKQTASALGPKVWCPSEQSISKYILIRQGRWLSPCLKVMRLPRGQSFRSRNADQRSGRRLPDARVESSTAVASAPPQTRSLSLSIYIYI